MKHRLGMVLPVTQLDLAEKLLRDLDANTVRPAFAVILDDSDEGFSVPPLGFDVELIRQTERIGVNALWNLGISKMPEEIGYVLVINDDMTIPNVLIEMILGTFDQCERAGAVHPVMVDARLASSPEVVHTSGGAPKYHRIYRQYGGAFTFRKEVLDQIPPIPRELFMYYGDNWLFDWTHKLGYIWALIENCIIYHHGSLGAKQRGLKRFLKIEKGIYKQLVVKHAL